ncbi:helix-turn-helix transcriptional regulator [Nonomuraea sp. NPDC023979]|uniref:helix-turn-helix domain-containing protein n=1 Tax=Nonomuraea sp. NPDC023979 TaxID=3154796 RepID=UPI0033E6B588
MAVDPKPGARAAREALRTELSVAGCTAAQIVAEMRACWGFRPREAWRHAHGWSLQQTADRLNEAAAARRGSALAADASLVGKWEKWPGPSSRRPSLQVLTLLAKVYGCTISDLLDLDDRRALPAEELKLLATPDGPADAEPSTAPASVPEPPALTGVELVKATAAESATWAQWAEATNIGDIALEQLHADTRTLAQHYITQDPLEVFQRARALRDRVFALLEGHQHPRQSTDLYAVAGYLCALLAWISSDVGQLRDADTQGRTAWLCAELAGHDDLRAWVLSTRSKIAFWDGRLRDAINLARRGATYQARGTVSVLLACQEADAWATLGALDDARNALSRAAAARDALSDSDEIGGIFSCTEFRHANYASAVLLRSGAADEALDETHRAFSHQHPHEAYGTLAQVRIVQAAAHLTLGEPDGALAPLRAVLALPSHQRLDPVTRRVRELAAAMARSPLATSSPAQIIQGEIEDWALQAVPRMLACSESPPII